MNESSAQQSIEALRKIIAEEMQGPQRRFRVLVVEDDTADATLLLHELEKFPCEAVLANDGERALQAIQQDGFNLMFLDLKLPGMSGEQLLQEVRKTRSSMSIVVVTGMEPGTISKSIEDMGMIVVLCKPITSDMLAKIFGMAAAA